MQPDGIDQKGDQEAAHTDADPECSGRLAFEDMFGRHSRVWKPVRAVEIGGQYKSLDDDEQDIDPRQRKEIRPGR